MNFCMKNHFFSREIQRIYITNKNTIMVDVYQKDYSTNDHIELTPEELTQINKTFLNIPKQSDQDKPDGS